MTHESFDELLANRHVPDLSLRQQQVAAACALLMTDEEVASLLVLSSITVRRHAAEAGHRVFDELGMRPGRTLLGRWCKLHLDCCARLAVRLAADGQLFDLLVQPVVIAPAYGEWTSSRPRVGPISLRRTFTMRARVYTIGIAAALALIAGVAWMTLAFAGHDKAADVAPNVSVLDLKTTAPNMPDPRAGMAQLIQEAPPEQTWALADGVVTYEEHEQAMEQFLACGESAGYERDPIPGDGLRPTYAGFISRAKSDGTASDHYQFKDAIDSCRMTYLEAIDVVWASGRPVPTTKDSERLYSFLHQCLAEGRTPTQYSPFLGSGHANEPEGGAVIKVELSRVGEYMQCALEGEALTGIMAPPPVYIS